MTNSLFGHLAMRFTSSEPERREVLARLLQLNHERYEEEKNAGLYEGKKTPTLLDDAALKRISKPRAKSQKAAPKAQLNWLSEPEPADAESNKPTPKEEATPTDQVGSWDQVVCLSCGKHLVGSRSRSIRRTCIKAKIRGIGKWGDNHEIYKFIGID